MDWVPFPFDTAFMQRALAAGVAVGVFAPMIGTFLVQKRMSLIGDGIGHLAFAGVAGGLLAGVWPIWTALAVSIVGAIAVDRLRSRGRASGDLALALFFYGGISLGVVLVGLAGSLNADLFGYLFGQVLLVTQGELVVIVALGAIVAATMIVLRRPLFAVVSDEEWARVAGLPVDLLNTVLAVLTAVAIVAAMRVVGILLVAALMVLPVGTAQLLARSFRGTIRWSMAVAVGSVVAGLAASRIWGLAPGGTIVLACALVFGVASVATSRRSPDRALHAVAPRRDPSAIQGAGRASDSARRESEDSVLGDSHFH
jgi:zinc transport system permease protein